MVDEIYMLDTAHGQCNPEGAKESVGCRWVAGSEEAFHTLGIACEAAFASLFTALCAARSPLTSSDTHSAFLTQGLLRCLVPFPQHSAWVTPACSPGLTLNLVSSRKLPLAHCSHPTDQVRAWNWVSASGKQTTLNYIFAHDSAVLTHPTLAWGDLCWVDWVVAVPVEPHSYVRSLSRNGGNSEDSWRIWDS